MEYFDVCDKNGLPTGEVIEREEAHRLGIRHRTAHVWIARNLPRSAKQLGSSSVEQPGSSPTGQLSPSPRDNTVNDVEILMQKRSLNKDSYPGMYDTSSAGHIPAGCEPLESALRELQEELGIAAKTEDLKLIGHFHIAYEEVFHGKPFRDNEYASVYLYTRGEELDVSKLHLQEEEVESVEWFSLAAVREEIKVSRERFCVAEGAIETLWEYVAALQKS